MAFGRIGKQQSIRIDLVAANMAAWSHLVAVRKVHKGFLGGNGGVPSRKTGQPVFWIAHLACWAAVRNGHARAQSRHGRDKQPGLANAFVTCSMDTCSGHVHVSKPIRGFRSGCDERPAIRIAFMAGEMRIAFTAGEMSTWCGRVDARCGWEGQRAIGIALVTNLMSTRSGSVEARSQVDC